MRDGLSAPLTQSQLPASVGDGAWGDETFVLGLNWKLKGRSSGLIKNKPLLIYVPGYPSSGEAQRQDIIPSSKASHHQSDSLECFAEVTTSAEPPHSYPKDWVKAIYSCNRCSYTCLDNINIIILNSFFKCLSCLLPYYQHWLLYQILLFGCHLQLLTDLVGAVLVSNSFLQFVGKYGVLFFFFFLAFHFLVAVI